MSKDNSTPRIQLRIVDLPTSDENYQHIRLEDNGEYITELTGFTGRDRAESIVRAVNRDHVFEELVHLCKWTLAVLDEEKWNTSLQAELRIALSKASKVT